MSRSRRKVPIHGITTAESDKPFKALGHRAARRRTRVVLGETRDGDAAPHPKEYGNPCLMPKDGKAWFRGDSATMVMRK